ncbi:2-amino-4-hydroxy-6-hydroxymethyldihydropteridine diphosphokinase [Hydrogenivirga caldilitoris]|uniref:2-amino-4-hydroxy-6-hydroxymethyldihydropteridine pyrophosphokinase n=1 Tax=Hydrogenivirga caldilitoris TaxID=246264 RepID=A0A497XM36_9AQUI|nr:2-amino-4-hydroxy-6-hydroxymethyldihydropteridine diphosphokinase [Hydrogenivirga caldilitoris]RLJ69905.1 2-amino-4-hydroxy-6-hydroxymethyldihydropteridine diphosphokinase [Hydrogenivirga caldilitoris]
MKSRERVFLGLGSNVGDRVKNILSALEELSRLGKLIKVSTVYESEPWGVEDQPPFLNCVVELKSPLPPKKLLAEVKSIEKKLGRIERTRWGPREIDIDILLQDNLVYESEELKLPHPLIEYRDFVLIPLLELDTNLINPKSGKAYKDSLPKIENRLKPFCCIRV